MGTKPQQVIENARDLVEHHADVLRPDGGRNAQQFFYREHVTMLVAHHGHVIQPVHVADALVVRLGLRQLFRRPMQQPDMRVRLLDDFAIHFEDEPEHTVRRRVLWPEIDGELLELSHCQAYP